MNILLTGAAGYIGSVLSRLLIKENHTVVAVDIFNRGGRSVEPLLDKMTFRLLEKDIRVKNEIRSMFDAFEIDVIVNLAAIVGDPACEQHPMASHDTNYRGVINLCDLADQYNVKKFIQASTCSVYGYSDEIINEEAELKPLSTYAKHKMDAEKYLLNSKVDVAILRFATAFGLSYNMRYDLTVNEFVYDVCMENKLIVYHADTWRPYCHVVDISRFINYFVKSKSKGIYNIGFDENNYTKDMIIKDILKTIPKPNITIVSGEGKDKRNYKVSFEKIKKEFKIGDFITVEAGIKEIFNHILIK